jgi:hypothetical protein
MVSRRCAAVLAAALGSSLVLAGAAAAGEEESKDDARAAPAGRADGRRKKAAGRGEEERPAPAPPGAGKEEEEEKEEETRSPARDQAEARIRELEESLWREIEAVEERLVSLKTRLGALLGKEPRRRSLEKGLSRVPGERFEERRPLPPRPPPGRPADAGEPLALDPEEESAYERLLKRQDDILKRWSEASGGHSRAGRGEGADKSIPVAPGEKDAAPGPERRPEREEAAALRAELAETLSRILDLREAARARQIERLRRELEDLERAMAHRRTRRERERLIEERMRELLDGGRP